MKTLLARLDNLSMWRRFILSFLMMCVAISAVILSCAVILPLPPLKTCSLCVEDRKGTFLQAFLAEDGIWRLQTSPDEIPPKLKRILLEKEDRYFMLHPGFNPFSILRALFQNAVNGKRISGASTITMQIARLLEPKDRTYRNKLIEVFRAIQLEMRFSKDELLQMYLSMVPLGGNVEGLKSAAMIYYQRPLERLNIAQLIDIILIPNDPNRLRPDKYPEELLRVRKLRSSPWIAEGLLTPEDSIVIWNTSARAVRQQLPRNAPHFCLRIKSMFPDSTHVQSSLDLHMQKIIERLVTNHLRPWKQHGVQNAAVVVLDNRTKEVVAYLGSENFFDKGAQGQVDAVKALRSPGSTLKPLLFALRMEHGLLTPHTRLLDTPYDVEGFQAENYDGNYSGLVFADDALRRSLNVPMIRLLKQTGVPPFVDFVDALGIHSLEDQKGRLGLSLIVGGCGVTLEELAGAYATFPAGGIFVPPTVLYRRDGTFKGTEVFSLSTAHMVTEILSGLDRPDLPNNFESAVNLPMVAFKTGTSYGRRDAWTLGYTREYTVGVWVGNVTYEGNPDLVGSRSAAPLAIDILNSISSKNQKRILAMPRDVATHEVCAHSGLLPNTHCDHLVEDFYSISRTSSKRCEVDKEYLLASDGSFYFCPTCLGNHTFKKMVFQEYPPELLSFLKATGLPLRSAPPHNPYCTRFFAGNGPTIVSPTDEMTYYFLSSEQKLVLQASSGLDVSEQSWYLDDKFLFRKKAGEKLFISPGNGLHTISCVDDKGRPSSVHIAVKYAL